MKPVLLLVVLAAVAAFSLPGNAGTQMPSLLLDGTPNGQVTRDIEQQSWWTDGVTIDPAHTVANPDHGMYGTWDINEHNSVGAEGYLAGGVTVTSLPARVVWESRPLYSCRGGTCAWWNMASHKFGVYMLSSSPAVTASTCFHPQGRCFPNSTPVYDSTRNHKGWVSRFCGQFDYSPDDPALERIPGSAVPPNTTDGVGAPSTVTVAVTNAATGKGSLAKDVAVFWGFSSDIWGEAGCSPTGHTASPPLPAVQINDSMGVVR